ncbi:MAG: hypothetical protein ACE5F1_18260 [Planctomycetota bacterium]
MKKCRPGLLWLLASTLCPGCSGYPRPSGTKMHVRVLSEEELDFDGSRMTWREFEDRITALVQAANQGQGPRPWIVILPDRHGARDVNDRFLDLLQDAGVRSVNLGR